MSNTRRHPESGFALLYVFAAASIVAIGLYEQLPRAAFEAQREKEGLLINHGEQYKRAVQLYVRKMGRYPAKMEDLDNTQNIRFLRKHYIDPMTGKEEWRLLHMGPNGKLIDSKIKAVDSNADQWHQGSITEFKSAASSDDGETLNANIAVRKRPSDDQIQPPMGGNAPPAGTITDPTQLASLAAAGLAPGGTAPAGAPPDPNAPKPPSWLNGGALPGMPPGQRGAVLPQTLPGTPTSTNPNQGSNAGSGSVSGNGGYGSVSGNGGYGNAPPSAPLVQPGQTPTPYSPNGPANGFNPNGGFGQPGAQASAANMINNLLTQPRPGGAPSGLPGALNGIGGSVQGGLAGVASTYKGRGIRHYNDQDEYPKWEFYYDLGAEQAAAVQNQMNQMNQKPGQSSANPQQQMLNQQAPPAPPPFGQPPPSQ